MALAVDTIWAEINSIKSSPYFLHVALLLTQPATIGRAISTVVHPAHFGCAQRKIKELQFPKSATGAAPPSVAIVRLFIIWFQLLLFVAPEFPVHAVKLLPAVVATFAGAIVGIAHKISNKNRLNNFIFSLWA